MSAVDEVFAIGNTITLVAWDYLNHQEAERTLVLTVENMDDVKRGFSAGNYKIRTISVLKSIGVVEG